jgi:hypothetical protein
MPKNSSGISRKQAAACVKWECGTRRSTRQRRIATATTYLAVRWFIVFLRVPPVYLMKASLETQLSLGP